MSTLRELISLNPEPERVHIRLYGSILDEPVPPGLTLTARRSQDADYTEDVWWFWMTPEALKALTDHWLGTETEKVTVVHDKLNPVPTIWNPLEGPSSFIKLVSGVLLTRVGEPSLRTVRPCVVKPLKVPNLFRDGTTMTLLVPKGALVPMTS